MTDAQRDVLSRLSAFVMDNAHMPDGTAVTLDGADVADQPSGLNLGDLFLLGQMLPNASEV